MKTVQKFSRWAEQALDLILPPRCTVSGDLVDRQGSVAPGAFAKLEFISAPYCESCGLPFEFAVDEKTKCTECLTASPSYKKARAALKYGEVSRDLILGFKHADKTHVVTSFAGWMARAGDEVLHDADILVPVPLHYGRMLKRRYNQAELISKALSRKTGIPCLSEALQRVRATPSQGHMKAGERAKNVKRAFAVNEKFVSGVKGKSIVLIDDVYTTGATVKECTQVLLKAGAKDVSVLTLARVVKGYLQN